MITYAKISAMAPGAVLGAEEIRAVAGGFG